MKVCNGAKRAIFLVNFIFFLLVSPAMGKEDGDDLILTNEAGEIVFSRPLASEGGFAIKYTHSVALSPVIDIYKVKDGEIYIDKTIYEDFGAGLPHNPGADQKMKFEKGKIELEGLNHKLPNLELRVGRVANHILILPGTAMDEEIPLNTLAAPGKTLKFSVKSK